MGLRPGLLVLLALLPQVNQATLPGSPFNETHFDNPKYISLYNQALATLDASMRTEIAHEMQMIDYNEGGYIIPFFPAVIDGYAPNVNGILESKTGFVVQQLGLRAHVAVVMCDEATDLRLSWGDLR